MRCALLNLINWQVITAVTTAGYHKRQCSVHFNVSLVSNVCVCVYTVGRSTDRRINIRCCAVTDNLTDLYQHLHSPCWQCEGMLAEDYGRLRCDDIGKNGAGRGQILHCCCWFFAVLPHIKWFADMHCWTHGFKSLTHTWSSHTRTQVCICAQFISQTEINTN